MLFEMISWQGRTLRQGHSPCCEIIGMPFVDLPGSVRFTQAWLASRQAESFS